MSTTCLQLLQLRSFQRIRLVAGEKGLYRKLTWPHICVMPSIAQWLHGGELLFITGSFFESDEAKLLTLIREAVQQKLAGIVLLVGGESKLTTTPSIRNFADENEFPLFEMPWELKLVDVIQEISEMVISQKELQDAKQRFFFELLFGSEHQRKFEQLCTLYSIPRQSHLAIAIFHPEDSEDSNLRDMIHKLSYHHALNCNVPDSTFIPAKHIGNVVCLIMANSEKDVRKLCKMLERFSGIYVPDAPSNLAPKLAFSRIVACEGCNVQLLYDEAIMALRAIQHDHASPKPMYYDQLGIYKLFFELGEASRNAFCLEQLGPLLHEDQMGSSALLETLRCYLHCGCNAVHSAQQLFIHKNTLNYRLNRIRNMLNVDLNDPAVRNNLYNALLIYDIFCSDSV